MNVSSHPNIAADFIQCMNIFYKKLIPVKLCLHSGIDVNKIKFNKLFPFFTQTFICQEIKQVYWHTCLDLTGTRSKWQLGKSKGGKFCYQYRAVNKLNRENPTLPQAMSMTSSTKSPCCWIIPNRQLKARKIAAKAWFSGKDKNLSGKA